MSTYYNFTLIDFAKFKEPPRDADGAYDFHSYKSIENVDCPMIQDTRKNALASGVIDLIYEEIKQGEEEEKMNFITFFGNLYWLNVEQIPNYKDFYLKNEWGLSELNFDYYSISCESLSKVVALAEKMDFKRIATFMQTPKFTRNQGFKMKKGKKSTRFSYKEFFQITQGWLNLYQLAIAKKKGLIYDIG